MTLSKKIFKQMKREVVEDTAINVGFFEDIFKKVPEDIWFCCKVFRDSYFSVK